MIAVDASLALKLVLDEPDSQAARGLWQEWTDRGETLVAPVLFSGLDLFDLEAARLSQLAHF